MKGIDKIIVVYEVNDYPEMDGGTHVKFFDTEREATKFLNETVVGDKERYSITLIGKLNREFTIKEKVVVKEFEIE